MLECTCMCNRKAMVIRCTLTASASTVHNITFNTEATCSYLIHVLFVTLKSESQLWKTYISSYQSLQGPSMSLLKIVYHTVAVGGIPLCHERQ